MLIRPKGERLYEYRDGKTVAQVTIVSSRDIHLKDWARVAEAALKRRETNAA